MSTANYITFDTMCSFLEDLSVGNSAHKQSVLKRFIDNYRDKGKKLSKQYPNLNTSFYPILRLLLPKLDRDRGPYNLQEHAFAKVLANTLVLPPKSEHYNLLYNFKYTTDKNIRDFTDAAVKVLKTKYSNANCSHSVTDLNNRLDDIASKVGDIRSQEAAIFELLKSMTSVGQKWTIRIILKNLKLHMGSEIILRTFHKDAERLFACNSSLLQLCEILQNPTVNLNEIEIKLFNAFQPMLSMRCDKKEFNKVVTSNKLFYLEEKFDGERFQLHYKNGEFKYFSRKGFNYSDHFGENGSSGYSALIKPALTKVSSIILDGEMMIWDINRGMFGSKGMNVDVKTLKLGGKYQPCFCVFDILYLNGKVVSGKPLSERKKLISQNINAINGVINVSNYTEAKSKEDIIAALNLSMDKEDEGIVFKDPSSVYEPNTRKNWWKLKLEYFEGLMSDLDVLIMGGYYMQGKKDIVDYLVGVIDDSFNDRCYLSFAKVGTGLSIEERKQINDKLQNHWRPINGKDHEKYKLYWSKEKPDIWIQPENSCCLTVRGSELIPKGRNLDYKTNYTLRFPRIIKPRLDKPFRDCLTVKELNALTNTAGSIVKLNRRHLDVADLVDEAKPKRRKTKFHAKTIDYEKKGDVLEGFEFVVLSGKSATANTRHWSVDDVEMMIRENGGTTVKVECSKTLCMLVGDNHIRAKTYKGEIDIVKLNWLFDVLNEDEFSMFKPRHMLYTSPKTKSRFLKMYDKFGDNYTKIFAKKDLKIIIDNFSKDDATPVLPSEIAKLEAQMGLERKKIFRGISAYFDKYKIVNNEESQEISFCLEDELDFIFQGGKSCDYLTADVDYIITNTGKPDRIRELELYLANMNSTIQIISTLNEMKTLICD